MDTSFREQSASHRERGTVEVKAGVKVKAFELFTNEENKKLTDFINAFDVLHGLGSSAPTQDNY